MPSSHASMSLPEQFRDHFGHREHLYGELLWHLAEDLEAGGPTARICRNHLESPREHAVSLRLLAALFRIVLREDAPALTPFYASLGGTRDHQEAWPLVREVLEAHEEELAAGLELAPQTNEVGRSACLVLGIFEAVRRQGIRRIRLLEPGASAGLNLLVDQFHFTGPDWAHGPADSPLTIATDVVGVRPEEFTVVSRRGCDVSPVDVASRAGADYLTSFVWPFDLTRHARLSAALEVASTCPLVIDAAPAASWLTEQLAEPVGDDVLTVVWMSITRQYWPAEETRAVEEVLAAARTRLPLAHVAMEGVPPTQMAGGFSIAEHGPTTTVDGDVILRSHHHGPPIVPVAL